MTPEEASKILRIHQECLKAQENGKCKHHLIARCEPCEYYTSDEDFNEAESMAIKYLQKETCEDAISRAEAMNALDALYLDGESAQGFTADANEDCLIGKYKAIEILDELPPVTPEQKIGHWIPRNSFLVRYKCSECEFESEEYNYCTNCGAKMEEGE